MSAYPTRARAVGPFGLLAGTKLLAAGLAPGSAAFSAELVVGSRFVGAAATTAPSAERATTTAVEVSHRRRKLIVARRGFRVRIAMTD
jgi:hypothetical protein